MDPKRSLGKGLGLALLTLTALISTGCNDSVQLTGPPDQALVDRAQDKPLDQTGMDRIGLLDSPRLHLSLGVEGSLVPGSPVTITVKADARMEFSSARIEVALPELEATKLTGVGKAFFAPVGVPLAKAGNWETGARAAESGEETHTVTVTFPAPGYYRVVGNAVTTPPKGQAEDQGRTTLDRHTVENWLLITDTGGKLTLDFEEEEVPAGMVISPGPFRKVERKGPKPSEAGFLSFVPKAIRSFFTRTPDAVVRVKYFDGSNWQYAADAYGYAEFYDDDPYEGGEVTQTFEELVGADGHYSLQCLGYYDWFANAKLKTDEISMYTYSGNWVSCGDTVEILIASQGRYEAMVDLKTIIPAVESATGTSRSVISVSVEEYGCGDSSEAYSCYTTSPDRITLSESHAINYPMVAGHEYGHALHHGSWGGLWAASNCGYGHQMGVVSSHDCAMLEGFASFIAQIGGLELGGAYSTWWANLDNVHYSHPDSAAMDEGNLSAFFWDLYDSNNEGDDSTTYSGSYLASVMSTCQGWTSSGWGDVITGPVFVWCLENGVPAWAVQDSIFPNHGQVFGYSEAATEPGTWDADDIRSTAVMNIGG